MIFRVLILSFCISFFAKAQEINLFDHHKGARIVSASSSYGGGWDVVNILENSPHVEENELPVWCTGSGAEFPHFVIVELPKVEWIDMIRFNNAIEDEGRGYPGISAKDVEVYISTIDSLSGYQKVLGVALENNKNNQIMKITPVEARWIKFVITSNYGNLEYTELGLIGVFDDKIRAKDLASEFKEKGFVNLYGIYFDFASANLKPESKTAIDQIFAFLEANPSQNIVIEGHTDNIGNEKFNQELSLKRAESVKAILVKQGIDAKRLTSKGLGITQPIATNANDAGRAQNRRVTIRK